MAYKFERNKFYTKERQLKVGSRVVRYVTQRPEVVGPDNKIRTALLVPGIVTRLRGMASLADILRQNGYTTVSMAHNNIDDDCPNDVLEMIQRTKEGAITGDGTPDLLVLAHSLGAIHSIRAMSTMDDVRDYVSGVTLLAPTGFGGVHPEPWYLLKSLLGELSERPATQDARDMTIEALGYSFSAGSKLVPKIIQARDDRVIDETLALIAGGMPFASVLYPHDALVHYAGVRQGLQEAGLKGTFDVDPRDRHVGHNAHFVHPEVVGEVVLRAIGYLYDGDLSGNGATLFENNVGQQRA